MEDSMKSRGEKSVEGRGKRPRTEAEENLAERKDFEDVKAKRGKMEWHIDLEEAIEIDNGHKLPRFKTRKSVLNAIKHEQIVIIKGKAGTEEINKLPQYLFEDGFTKNKKKIACTKPYRVSALTAAARVAEDLSVKLGKEVGYSVRFEEITSNKTKIKFLTNMQLCREMLSESNLTSYSVVIVDEADERTLATDMLLGFLKLIAKRRCDLKIIIISEYSVDKLLAFFDNASIVPIQGHGFPFSVIHTKAPVDDYLLGCVEVVLKIYFKEPPGDILIYLPTQKEVEKLKELLLEMSKKYSLQDKFIILKFHEKVQSHLQENIYKRTPKGSCKVVLATNIAESSLTIDGMIYVIDIGLCKKNEFDYTTDKVKLDYSLISKATAEQRADRAGRVAAGKCYRLYTQQVFASFKDKDVPQVESVNLRYCLLLINSLNIHHQNFKVLDPFPLTHLSRAHEQLCNLGAINSESEVTQLGRNMVEFPVDPMMAKMLLASEKYKCSEEILSIAAMLSVNNTIFYIPEDKDKKINAEAARKKFFSDCGDHFILLNVYNKWIDQKCGTWWCYQNYIKVRSMKRAREIRKQLQGIMNRMNINILSNPLDTTKIRKSIIAGYFYHVARFTRTGEYKIVQGTATAMIHPDSALLEDIPRLLLYHDCREITKPLFCKVVAIQPT